MNQTGEGNFCVADVVNVVNVVNVKMGFWRQVSVDKIRKFRKILQIRQIRTGIL